MAKSSTLTPKKKKFIALFDGNLRGTARKAKISYSYARKLAEDPEVAKLLKKREEKRNNSAIMDRAARQLFWTKVIRGQLEEVEPTVSDRLKASELLGRSEADFIERRETKHSGGENIMSIVADIMAKRGK